MRIILKIIKPLVMCLSVILCSEVGLRIISDESFAKDRKIVLNELPSNRDPQKSRVSYEDLIVENFMYFSNKPKMAHPYFGYVYNWGLASQFNRDGFDDEIDFSNIAKENDQSLNIAIFGGSVASSFAKSEKINFKYNRQSIAGSLIKAYPQLINKKIHILNFAIDGHRQPQSYFISSYFLDKIDLCITIDGYNEISFPLWPEFPASFPGFSTVLFSKEPKRYEFLMEIIHLRSQLQILASKIESSAWLAKSFLVGHLYNFYSKYIISRIIAIQEGAKNDIDDKHPYYSKDLDLNAGLEIRADVWKKFSLLQSQQFNNHSIPNFHFIQPNQHIKNSKTLSQIELAQSFNKDRVELINLGYEKLFSRIPDLKNRGHKVFSLVNIFQDEKATVYIDKCCHLNSLGEEILSREISKHIIEGLRSSQNINWLREK